MKKPAIFFVSSCLMFVISFVQCEECDSKEVCGECPFVSTVANLDKKRVNIDVDVAQVVYLIFSLSFLVFGTRFKIRPHHESLVCTTTSKNLQMASV